MNCPKLKLAKLLFEFIVRTESIHFNAPKTYTQG